MKKKKNKNNINLMLHSISFLSTHFTYGVVMVKAGSPYRIWEIKAIKQRESEE